MRHALTFSIPLLLRSQWNLSASATDKSLEAINVSDASDNICLTARPRGSQDIIQFVGKRWETWDSTIAQQQSVGYSQCMNKENNLIL
ncbi:hypothetical protein BDV59DRAFT_64400 [Aspergillus ambiguus]|uniref:uncharacterized protein n=1 Tax=Aspergillus ambiguus TaxID=176160 RepID=UPI003CCDCDE1